MEQVILVDEQDNPIGLMEKQAAHIEPHLHRAFSIFLFNSKGELLMQQRALSKSPHGDFGRRWACDARCTKSTPLFIRHLSDKASPSTSSTMFS